MGSEDGLGGGGMVVREVRLKTEGACSSGAQNDEIRAVNASAPASWNKIPDSELCREASQHPSLYNDDAPSLNGLRNTTSPSLALDLEAKLELQRFGRIIRSNSLFTKRSGVVETEISKTKPGLHDVNGVSLELSSSPAGCNVSEKTQKVRQKNNSNSKRGDRRNNKVNKNRCDSFSLKNGFVGINSTAGGNNFFGLYGLKSDVFDITKYVNELSLDELLHGSDKVPGIAKDKGKKAASSNINLMQSVRKACSVLQAPKVLQAHKCAEIDNSCIQNISSSLVDASSPEGQTDREEAKSCSADFASPDKVEESGDKIKTSNSVTDSPLYQPKHILERLGLPPPKDLDLLLSDAVKTTSTSKNNSSDPRLGKSVQRTGLPPFPWSHSFSGHSKLGADAVKSSSIRSTCHGRWVKVQNSAVLQKGSADLLSDFESLKFDQSLVPKVNLIPARPDSETAPTDRVLSNSGACSTIKVPAADEPSPTYAAAQTLCTMATFFSKENPTTVKFPENPPQMSIKACKSIAREKSHKLFDAPKSRMRPHNPVKFGEDEFPSKKLKLTSDTTNVYISHNDSIKKRPIHLSASQTFKPPPRKIFKDSVSTDSYSRNIVKNSYMMKPPRGADRPSSSQQKLRKVDQVKLRPES
ncbi:hypothetical protein ACJIZ3_003920 [Penstemon smallii]|uniref:Uncharacterized protein n=1 Tax=Penstemon smallii TaxID=265156 RepID=A0ABD3S0M6_9LAMI